MYIDWVIVSSLIIVALTCAVFGYCIKFAIKKIHEDEHAVKPPHKSP